MIKEKKLFFLLKAYKLYNPNTNKFIIIYIVIFYEIKFWTRCNHGVKQNIPMDLDGENKKKKEKSMEDAPQLINDQSILNDHQLNRVKKKKV